MKTVKIFILFSLGFFFLACEETVDPNTLGGDVKTEISNVGDEFGLSVQIGDEHVNLNEQIVVKSNDNGLVTLNVKANVSSAPKIKELLDKSPIQVYDNQGNVDIDVQFKVTTEGIQDFFNKDHKAHTLVKYDAKVGDQYKLTNSDGITKTRTVIARSDEDDFPIAFWKIKTITIEQDSRTPGIQKYVYRANHKFGIVYVEIYLEDGSKVSSYIFAPNLK